MERYLIFSESEDGFWSNDDGWGELDSATVYNETDWSLPMAAGNDARWVTFPEAEEISLIAEVVVDGVVLLRSGDGNSAAVIYNNLINANKVSDYLGYLTWMAKECEFGGDLMGKRIEYRERNITISKTTIPSPDPEMHRVRGGLRLGQRCG